MKEMTGMTAATGVTAKTAMADDSNNKRNGDSGASAVFTAGTPRATHSGAPSRRKTIWLASWCRPGGQPPLAQGPRLLSRSTYLAVGQVGSQAAPTEQIGEARRPQIQYQIEPPESEPMVVPPCQQCIGR